MKNKIVLLVVVAALFWSANCSFYNPDGNTKTKNSNEKPLDEKAIDKVVSENETGVPECDELLKVIADQSKKDDDNMLTKAARQLFFNQIRDKAKQNIEENKGDKKAMAKKCLDYKDQVDNFKGDEKKK